MSSGLSNFISRKEGLTRFIKPDSPCFDNSGNGDIVLFPFTLSRGVLDITYEGNFFREKMVDICGQQPDNETDTIISITGGPYLVTSLGENFKQYIRAWRDTYIDDNSPIEIFIAPQMYRVQEAQIENIDANSSDPFNISTNPPSGDGYKSGTVGNNYGTTYIFKTPLTFTILDGGVTQYITLRTILDQE